jgi:hypothetical protein
MLLKMIPKRIKVWLIKRLYKDIAAEGRMGDTQLAHINDYEARLLKSVGGSGTINPATGLVEYGKGGGGGQQPAAQQSTSYSTNLPEYAEPYYKEQMKQVANETYNTDSSGNVTGVKGAAVYQGPRVAGFRNDQYAAQNQTRNLRDPAQIAQGTNALNRAMGTGNYAMNQGIGSALAYSPDTITSENIYAGYTRPSTVSDTFNDQNVSDVFVDDTVSTSVFTPSAAANYMNPYQQQVVDVQTQEARRQADIAKSGRGLGSISRGTFGGGRQALMEAEADRALATQLGAIQATGSQQAYQQGQQAFTQDQARRLQADQANQSADIQAEKYNQDADLQTQQMRQQSQTANQAADLKAQQLRQESQKVNQATRLQTGLANQAADLKAQGMQQAGDQFGADLDKQLGLAGIQAQSAIGGQYAQIAANERMTELKTLVAQSTDAEEIQRLNQEMLSLEYQQFREEQDYEKQQVQFMSDILRGNAGALGSTDVQYAAAPSLASQIGGGVAGIAGLYGALSGGMG